MSKLYEILGGKVASKEIPASGITLQVSRRADYRQPIAMPGGEHGQWADCTIDHVAEIAARLTPWAKWYCSPRKSDDTETGGGRSVGHAHIIMQGCGWLSTMEQPTNAVSYAFHEAYHLAEDHITASERQAVDDGIHGIPNLPSGAWEAYYCSPRELRANTFEAWAYSYWLRGRMPEYRRGMPDDERVFAAIYRGDLGLRIARRGLIQAERMNEALRQRMEERSDSQCVFDAVRRGVLAAWEWLIDAFRADVPTVK